MVQSALFVNRHGQPFPALSPSMFHITTPMKTRSRSNVAKLVQLSLAVPQVVGHRVTRMALSGPLPNERDRREFTGMVIEKQMAFAQSWFGMMSELARLQQQWFLGSFSGTRPDLHRSVQSLAAKGIEPIHRKAVANAKRLSRTRLR